jgi:hypothetical protein
VRSGMPVDPQLVPMADEKILADFATAAGPNQVAAKEAAKPVAN